MRSARHRVLDMLQAVRSIERYAVRGKTQLGGPATAPLR